MITIPTHTLWTLLGIWLVVAACVFMFGWNAALWTRERRERRARSIRRHPSTRYQPDHLPRPGRLLVHPADSTAIDIARWWPALERQVTQPQPSRGEVEMSNWERNKRREMDAWLHERGMRDEDWLRDVQ